MDRVSALLPKILHKRGIASQAHAALLLHAATHWVSDHLPSLKHTLHPSTFRDGTLTITSDNSIAAQECHRCLPAMLSALKSVKGIEDTPLHEIHIIRS